MNGRIFRTISLLLIPCLLADTLSAAGLSTAFCSPANTVSLSVPQSQFNEEALSLRIASIAYGAWANPSAAHVIGGATVLIGSAAGFTYFTHAGIAINAAGIWKGLAAITGVTVAALGASVQTVPSDPFAQDRKKQQELWLRHSSLRGPEVVTWKDRHNVEHSTELTYEIADTQIATLQQIADVVLNFSTVLEKNELLTENQIHMMEWYRRQPKLLYRRIRQAIQGTPWTIVARDPSGRIVGVVFPAIGPRGSADVSAPTMNGMLTWHKPIRRSWAWLLAWRRMMGDYWFMAFDYAETDGHGAIAEAMLAKSLAVAQRLGIRRFLAYSNPVGYATFAQKHPGANIVDYLARVLAVPILKRLLQIAKQGDIATWEKLFDLLMQMADDHAVGDLATVLGGKIAVALDQFADAQKFPAHPTPEDFYHLLESFAKPYAKGGYTVNEPALGVHLKAGRKMARIIEDAFVDFQGEPSVGGGYSVNLVKDIPLLPEIEKRREKAKYLISSAVVVGGAISPIIFGVWLARRLVHNRSSGKPRSALARSA